MGNCFSPSTFCSSDHSRRPRRRLLPSSAVTSEPPDDAGLGHSFCYVTTPHPQHPTCSSSSYSLSGAALPANTSTALSTSILSSSAAPFSSAFDSSTSFSSFPLHPIPRFSPSSLSAPLDRGFLSGPLDPRSSNVLFSGPLNESFHPLKRSFSQGGRSLMRSLSKAIGRTVSIPAKIIVSSSSSSSSNKDSSSSSGSVEMSDEINNNNNNNNDNNNNNLQWAQGKAGEDRVHVVVSEEHGWLFVGIYDGFNGPDATDYLLSNLYTSIRSELEGMVWVKEERDGDMGGCDGGEGEGEEWRVRWKCTDWERRDHGEVLKAMDVGLRRTEEGFLGIAADVFGENPELGLMGSCVLVAVMKGEDLYVMNVGDSRAVLGQRDHVVRSCSREESFTDLDVEEVSPSLSALQLTLDHSTCVQEEVRRIRSEHPDDDYAVVNNRVKGSLKVTRAFGAGFLKQPKWNDALLEVFRIDYVGTSPYITCTPFLHHHRLGPRDKFLILSSDGLYQYFTNEEAVAQVEHFIAMTPEGDPAQHLVEEVIFRAAKKAGESMNMIETIHQRFEIPAFFIKAEMDG